MKERLNQLEMSYTSEDNIDEETEKLINEYTAKLVGSLNRITK
jgi:hypothetical protein